MSEASALISKFEDLQKKYEDSFSDQIVKKYNITKVGPGPIGLDEEKGIYYGWSHRAVCGFKVGDKIFEADYGDEDTLFTKHGSKTIENIDDAKLAAKRFADYVG